MSMPRLQEAPYATKRPLSSSIAPMRIGACAGACACAGAIAIAAPNAAAARRQARAPKNPIGSRIRFPLTRSCSLISCWLVSERTFSYIMSRRLRCQPRCGGSGGLASAVERMLVHSGGRRQLDALLDRRGEVSGSESTHDVVVVGGGGSGLAAAIEAATLGRSVVVLEKANQLGGSTGRSIGSISASATPHQIRKGIKDNPQDHFEDLGLFNARVGIEDNVVLRRILTDNANETLRWLMSMGVTFFGPMPEPPHRKPRMHNVLPNSRAYIWALRRRCSVLGVEIRT